MSKNLNGRLWIDIDGKNFLGTGRIELLERIKTTGSIKKAAAEIGMSYKAAWDAIDAMNNLSEQPVVLRQTGGKEGGGTKITPYGEKVITVFRQAEEEHAQFLAKMKQKVQSFDEIYTLIRRLSMKVSVRNQLAGKVTKIVKGQLNSEVDIEISGGDIIAAVITNESVERLGLSVGGSIYALIKASSVMVGLEKAKISARNQLKGVIEFINEGCLNCEVRIKIAGDNVVVAQITKEALNALGLQVGMPAYAVIKASSVIVGVE